MKSDSLRRRHPSSASEAKVVAPPAHKKEKSTDDIDTSDEESSVGLAFSFLVAVLSGLAANSSFGVLTKTDPGCSHCVTLLQQAFSLTVTWGIARGFYDGKEMYIPLGYHLAGAVCVISACMLGNKSLDWGLPLPLFFLIKCGNLAASMLVGFVLVGKKYAPRQIIAVSFVTLGLLLSTASANKGGAEGGGGSDAPVVGSVIVGAVALFLALVSNSLLGVVQEVAFRTYGKHFNEMLFFSTLLFMPIYGFLNKNSILTHAFRWMDGMWREVWLPLTANIIFNHICRTAMCELTASSSLGSLCAMFATTAFRFASILVAAMIETYSRANEVGGNSPLDIWGGISLVLVGSLLSLSPPGKKPPAPAAAETKTTTENSKEEVFDENEENESIKEEGTDDESEGGDSMPSPLMRKQRSLSWSPPKLSRGVSAPGTLRISRSASGHGPLVSRGFSRVISSDLLASWGGESPSVSDLRHSWSSSSMNLLGHKQRPDATGIIPLEVPLKGLGLGHEQRRVSTGDLATLRSSAQF